MITVYVMFFSWILISKQNSKQIMKTWVINKRSRLRHQFVISLLYIPTTLAFHKEPSYHLYYLMLPTNPHHSIPMSMKNCLFLFTKTKNDTATLKLQSHLNTMLTWFNKWRIKLNGSKSCHTTFTLQKKSFTRL